MVFNFATLAFIFGLIWLLILSYFIWKLYAHYNSLIGTTNHKTLMPILDSLLKQVGRTEKDIDFLKIQCDRIEKEGEFHIQKIGLLRFNPFNDTGGDQSFILALLDNKDNGLVMSGLYSRAGTRWFAKKVKGGKGADHELSDDEMKAIQQSKKLSQ